MIDMGQADRTLRTHNRPPPYTWADIKPKQHITRGDICVVRRINGAPEMFRLVDQHHYKEWVGCFTYMGEMK
jgi:hypothetical protein